MAKHCLDRNGLCVWMLSHTQTHTGLLCEALQLYMQHLVVQVLGTGDTVSSMTALAQHMKYDYRHEYGEFLDTGRIVVNSFRKY